VCRQPNPFALGEKLVIFLFPGLEIVHGTKVMNNVAIESGEAIGIKSDTFLY
jgi:hypothetical protein